MILLRDFVLFVLPILVAAGGWLYALRLRKQLASDAAQRTSSSGPRSREELNAP